MEMVIQHDFCRALAREREGHYQEALRLFSAILERDASHTRARVHRARMCALTGHVRQAVADFRRVLADDAGDVEARLNLAALYLLLGLEGDAETHLRLAMRYADAKQATDEPDAVMGVRIRASLADPLLGAE